MELRKLYKRSAESVENMLRSPEKQERQMAKNCTEKYLLTFCKKFAENWL